MKAIASLVVLLCWLAAPALARAPALPATDRVRIAEAFRLADALTERLWAGWSQAPFAVLLVTPEREFLIRHPRPTSDFQSLGDDSLLKSKVWTRSRQFDPHLLATFPAVAGVPTIVIGQAESTQAGSSTPWVLTLLHEHFHQLQYSRPDYYRKTHALGLARGDTTGMWMLEYPFPYTDAEVGRKFDVMRAALDTALHASPATQKAAWADYLEAREATLASLKPDDAKYLGFQLWQEGIARYTEVRMAALAAERSEPSAEFRALPDYRTYAEESARAMRRIDRELAVPLADARRTAFYAIGAAEGLLLDRMEPSWRAGYFKRLFTVSSTLTGE